MQIPFWQSPEGHWLPVEQLDCEKERENDCEEKEKGLEKLKLDTLKPCEKEKEFERLED